MLYYRKCHPKVKKTAPHQVELWDLVFWWSDLYTNPGTGGHAYVTRINPKSTTVSLIADDLLEWDEVPIVELEFVCRKIPGRESKADLIRCDQEYDAAMNAMWDDAETC